MIAIVNCEIGNLRSVQKAFEFIGSDAVITADKETIAGADAVVLPGVGAFGDAAEFLAGQGLAGVIKEFISGGRPFLGICVGLQLFMQASEEYGMRPAGLAIMDGRVVRLPETVKIPEMGWNTIDIKQPDCPILKGTPADARFYFAHSYCLEAPSMRRDNIAATTDYGFEYCSVAWRDNVYGVQFHPEKSGANGLNILKKFAELQ